MSQGGPSDRNSPSPTPCSQDLCPGYHRGTAASRPLLAGKHCLLQVGGLLPCRPRPKDAQVQQHQFPRNGAQLHPHKVSLGHKPPMQRATKSPGDKIRPSHTWNPSQLGKPHPPARQAACGSRAPHRATHPHACAVQGTVILDEPVVIAPICRERNPAMSVPAHPAEAYSSSDPEMR